MKVCNCCNLKKPLSAYHKRSNRPQGVTSVCKECRSEIEKKRYAANREKIISQKREYNNINREKINQRQLIYNRGNKHRLAEYVAANRDKINKQRRERLANDPVYNMQDRIRRRINYALKVSGYRKSNKTEIILGCSWSDFIAHIESQFTDGMTWENRGEWELDHIIPYATAKTESDVLRLSHYTNIQPLWKKDNREKSSKY